MGHDGAVLPRGHRLRAGQGCDVRGDRSDGASVRLLGYHEGAGGYLVGVAKELLGVRCAWAEREGRRGLGVRGAEFRRAGVLLNPRHVFYPHSKVN